MRLAKDIPVRRGKASSAVEALQRCREKLEHRMSVMIFPEGTRSETDEMQVPILPLVVTGSRTALKKRSWRFGRSEAEVRVLEPVRTEGLKKADVGLLRDKVFALIAAERERMRTGA
jgi:1-acyl-sn-glycerol-3-phosphate acyltransferase